MGECMRIFYWFFLGLLFLINIFVYKFFEEILSDSFGFGYFLLRYLVVIFMCFKIMFFW